MSLQHRIQVRKNSELKNKLEVLGSRVENEELAILIGRPEENNLLAAIELIKKFLDDENQMFETMGEE